MRIEFIVDARAEANSPGTIATLLEICGACPVRRECLGDALSAVGWTPEGVWGGTTIAERRNAMPRVTGIGSNGLKSPAARQEVYRGRSHSQLVDDLVDEFEASFPTRLQSWQRKARRHRAELRRRAALREAEAATG
jgi:hypothetical protein